MQVQVAEQTQQRIGWKLEKGEGVWVLTAPGKYFEIEASNEQLARQEVEEIKNEYAT